MIEWKTNMMNILDIAQGSIGWTDIGSKLLQRIYDTNADLYSDYQIFNGLDNMYPINWNRYVREFIDLKYDNYTTIVRKYQPLVVLVNSVYRKLETLSEKEILEGSMPLNYFINKSLQNKGICKKIFEEIYMNQLWNNGNHNIPLSGPGSSLENTKECSKMINDQIYSNDCKSVLDLGCGDLTWMCKTPFLMTLM